jgi:hypothetical protein
MVFDHMIAWSRVLTIGTSVDQPTLACPGVLPMVFEPPQAGLSWCGSCLMGTHGTCTSETCDCTTCYPNK